MLAGVAAPQASVEPILHVINRAAEAYRRATAPDSAAPGIYAAARPSVPACYRSP